MALKLSKKEISILTSAREVVRFAMEQGNRWAIGEAVSTIVDLGYSVLWLFISDEVFEQRIKEYSDGE